MISLNDIVRSMDGSVAHHSQAGAGATLPSLRTTPLGNVVIDSRLVTPGDLFVSLPGEQVDGHRFVADAFRRGARAALVREAWVRGAGSELDLPVVRAVNELDELAPDQGVLLAVPDPLTTIQTVAASYRRRFDLAVIGITGSVGKTTTKEVVAAVLRQGMPTLGNVRSWNNEIGLPLTLLRLTSEHRAAVLEMGTYGPGEIALLCQWAAPTYAIVTNVGVSHLERMRTADVVAEAKGELPRALPRHGAAFLNYDDKRVRAMADMTAARPVFYGFDPRADLWADNVVGRGLDGISFMAHWGDQQHSFTIPLIGRHHVYAALAAIAVARELGLGWDQIESGLCDTGIKQRLVALPGTNGTTLLDDSYNAAPASVKAAFAVLNELPGRHLAVLGPMAELGPIEEAGHREVGRAAAEVLDLLVVIGPKAQWIGEAALERKPTLPVIFASDNAEATTQLRALLQPGDFLLVKGARVAMTEQIVQALAVGA